MRTDIVIANGQCCANCQAELHGPYCAECGQHAHHSARTLGTLLHDGWHTLTHIDSRAWRSFTSLLFRPGRLTVEYLADHRERYLPPVRLYLICALFFFALVGPGSEPAPESAHTQAAAQPQTAAPPQVNAPAQPATQPQAGTVPCEIDAEDNDGGWLTQQALRACREVRKRDMTRLTQHWLTGIPRMMLVFLPVMAAICLLFYWRPRRLYVEHLVFFLHAHAALYLLALLVSAANWLLRLWAGTRWLAGVLTFAGIVYVCWYLFRAMRVTYQQGRLATSLKYLMFGFSYAVCLGAMLLLTYAWAVIRDR